MQPRGLQVTKRFFDAQDFVHLSADQKATVNPQNPFVYNHFTIYYVLLNYQKIPMK